ncbi:MAG: HDIG domain-containing protein [Candidatus Abyssobacteria bacterium SURF_5]|uniref:HDIG domain-containing protein n=1 Tax=Abyssobacteria bacterium (strain SURF_5) TaxID=2093360 RepID=A0A3A4MWG6_ABYX5|nr:MAG: HDIG domain-containing protein [Candidatus Abyssubacteria bacterium SURF_5]
MTREEALALVNGKVRTKNLRKHMFATEACMRALAGRLGGDRERWAMAGLLHDLDYDETVNDFSRHGYATCEYLRGTDVPADILDAIMAHTGHTPARTQMDMVLYAVDPLTGFLVAAALMHPSKKIADVDVAFAMNRFKEKRFAAGANRDQMKKCEEFGLRLEEFIRICLEAMQKVSQELGL